MVRRGTGGRKNNVETTQNSSEDTWGTLKTKAERSGFGDSVVEPGEVKRQWKCAHAK